MKPSSRLYDGTAQAWEETVTTSEFRTVKRTYAQFGDVFPCAVQVRRRALADRGPGEEEAGDWMVYAPIDGAPLIESGMVVQVLSGPEEGKTLRVQDPYRPRNRFQQLECFNWSGDLPE